MRGRGWPKCVAIKPQKKTRKMARVRARVGGWDYGVGLWFQIGVKVGWGGWCGLGLGVLLGFGLGIVGGRCWGWVKVGGGLVLGLGGVEVGVKVGLGLGLRLTSRSGLCVWSWN